jgi:DNA repair ATPase RecN
MEPEVLYATINGLENESSALKTAVAKLGAIVEEINKIKARQKELQSEYKEISTDQDRLRQNLHTVGKNTDLGQHYLKTMKDQETRLITIHDLSKKLKDDIKEKQKEAKKISIELVLE